MSNLTTSSHDASALNDTARLPSPYAYGGIDTVNVLRAKLTPDAFQGFCIGMIHKRLHRGLLKTGESRVKDFEVAEFYMDMMMESLIGASGVPRNRADQRTRQIQNLSGAGGFLPYGQDHPARNSVVEALFAPEEVRQQGVVAQQQRNTNPAAANPSQPPGPQTPGGTNRGPAPNPYDPGARR